MMSEYDPLRKHLSPEVRAAIEDLYIHVSAMVDPDNAPTAVFMFAVDALLRVCRVCMDEEVARQNHLADRLGRKAMDDLLSEQEDEGVS
jgi:hypothetical protein